MMFRSVGTARQRQGDNRRVQVLPNAAVVYAIQQHVEETFEFLRLEDRPSLPSGSILVALASVGQLLGLVENDIERLLNLEQKESSFAVTGMSYSEFVDAVRCCAVLHGHLALEALPVLQVPDLSHALYKTYMSYSQAQRPHTSGAQCQCRLVSGEPPPRMFWESFLRVCRDAGFVQPEGPLTLPALERIWAACSVVCEKSLPGHACFGEFLRALAVMAGQLKAEIFVTVAALGLAHELPALKHVPNNYRYKHYREVPLNLGGTWSLPHLTFEALVAAVQEGRQYEYSQFIHDAQHAVLLDELQQQQWRGSTPGSPVLPVEPQSEAAVGLRGVSGSGSGGSPGSGVVRASRAAISRVRPWSAGLTVLSPHMRRRGAAAKVAEGDGSPVALGASGGSLHAGNSLLPANLLTGGAVAGGWVVGNAGLQQQPSAAATASQLSTTRGQDWPRSGNNSASANGVHNGSSHAAHGSSAVHLAGLSRGPSIQGGRELAGGDGPPPPASDRAFGSPMAPASVFSSPSHEGPRVAINGGRCRSAHVSPSAGSSARLTVAWAPISLAAGDEAPAPAPRSAGSSRLRLSRGGGSMNGLETAGEGPLASPRAGPDTAGVTAAVYGGQAGLRGSSSNSTNGGNTSSGNDCSSGSSQGLEGRLQALEERSQEVMRLLAHVQSQVAVLMQQSGTAQGIGQQQQHAEGFGEEDAPTPTAALSAVGSSARRPKAQLRPAGAPQGDGVEDQDGSPQGGVMQRVGAVTGGSGEAGAAAAAATTATAEASGPGAVPIPVVAPVTVNYFVTVRTSNLPDAGTDVTALIKLYGTRGDTAEHQLEIWPGSLEQGQVNAFLLEGPDVGDVKRVRVRVCTRSGGSEGAPGAVPDPTTTAAAGPTWHLDAIDVVSSSTCTQYSFPFRGWFDGDRGLEQTLDCIATAPFAGPAPEGWRGRKAAAPGHLQPLPQPHTGQGAAVHHHPDREDEVDGPTSYLQLPTVPSLATFPDQQTSREATAGGEGGAAHVPIAQASQLSESLADLQRRVGFLEASRAEHSANAAAAMAAALLVRVPAPILAAVRYGKGGPLAEGSRTSLAKASSDDSSLALLADLLSTVYARTQEGAAAAEAAEARAGAALDASKVQEGRLRELQEGLREAAQASQQATAATAVAKEPSALSLAAPGGAGLREGLSGPDVEGPSLDSPRQLMARDGVKDEPEAAALDDSEPSPQALASDVQQCKARVSSLASGLKRLAREQGDVRSAVARAELLLAELRSHQAHLAAALMGTATALVSLRCGGPGRGHDRQAAQSTKADCGARASGGPEGDDSAAAAPGYRAAPGTPSLGSEPRGLAGRASRSGSGSGAVHWSSGSADGSRDAGSGAMDARGESAGGVGAGGVGDALTELPPAAAVESGSGAESNVRIKKALRMFVAELRHLAGLVVAAPETEGGGSDGGRWPAPALMSAARAGAAGGGGLAAEDLEARAGAGDSGGVLLQLEVLGRQLETQASELAALRAGLLLQERGPAGIHSRLSAAGKAAGVQGAGDGAGRATGGGKDVGSEFAAS